MKRIFLLAAAALCCAAPAHAETFRARYEAIIEDMDFNDYMIGIATEKAEQGSAYASCEALNLAAIGYRNDYDDMTTLADEVDQATQAERDALPDLHAEADALEELADLVDAKYEENCG